jgi:5-methylcytosine-specific restriction endonuclease McrA
VQSIRLNKVGIPILTKPKKNKDTPAKKKRAIPRLDQIRAALFEKDNGKCHYCQTEIKRWRTGKQEKGALSREVGTIDHVNPIAKGGSSDVSNLVLSCEICNFQKSDTPYEEFIKNTLDGKVNIG